MTGNDIIPGFDDDSEESLKIMLQKVSDVESCLIIVFNGYIDTYNSNYVQKQVQKVLDAGFIRLIFHCVSLNHISSAGIGAFSAFLKAVKPKGGDLVLTGVLPKVQEVFQLLGFSNFFIIKDSLDDAINFYRNVIFHTLFPCPVCSKKLKADKPGRFRCSECKTIIAVDDTGTVSLG